MPVISDSSTTVHFRLVRPQHSQVVTSSLIPSTLNITRLLALAVCPATPLILAILENHVNSIFPKFWNTRKSASRDQHSHADPQCFRQRRIQIRGQVYPARLPAALIGVQA